MTLRCDTDQTPDTLPALPTPSSRHGCISLAIRPPEALLCFRTVQPVLFVTALNVSKNWKWDFKRASELKIHPFRVVTIVQWWQQSCVSVFWLLALAVSGNFPGSLWLLWLFRLFSCHTCTSQEGVLYQVQRNYVVTDISLKRFKKLAKSVNGCCWLSFWLGLLRNQMCDTIQRMLPVTIQPSALCSPHNITIRVKFITGAQWRLPLNINTSPHQLPIHNLHRWQLLYSVPCLPPTILNGRHYNSSFFQFTYFI